MSEQNKPNGVSLPHDEMIGYHSPVIEQSEVPPTEVNEMPAPQQEVMHGGYTGARVGEMALRISRLQEQGNMEAANALTEQLDKISPPVEK